MIKLLDSKFIPFILFVILVFMISLLSPLEYSIWVAFTIFGSLGLQLEAVVSQSSIRSISLLHFKGDNENLFQISSIAWRKLSILAYILTPIIFLVGLIYFYNLYKYESIEISKLVIAWSIFIATYILNYTFSVNGMILQARDQINSFNYINSASRVTQLILSILFLYFGASILGLSLSFLISVMLGIVLIRSKLKILNFHKSIKDLRNKPEINISLNEYYDFLIKNYFVFVFFTFLLIKGSYLIISPTLNSSTGSAYSLSLQIGIVLSTFSLIAANQVFIPRISSAIISKNRKKINSILKICFIFQNLSYFFGAFLIFFLYKFFYNSFEFNITLLNLVEYFLLNLALLIEVNICFLAGYMITKSNMSFVRHYSIASLLIFIISLLCFLYSQSLIYMISTIVILQLLISLPIMFKNFYKEVNTEL